MVIWCDSSPSLNTQKNRGSDLTNIHVRKNRLEGLTEEVIQFN